MPLGIGVFPGAEELFTNAHEVIDVLKDRFNICQ